MTHRGLVTERVFVSGSFTSVSGFRKWLVAMYDMISAFAPYGDKFAVFNIADSCLTVGVCLAVLLELMGRQRDGSKAVRKKAEPA